MKKKQNNDCAFSIFFSVCAVLSAFVFVLLGRFSAAPVFKMFADIFIVVLLLVLNTTILVLHEKNKNLRKKIEDITKENNSRM